MEQQSAPDLSTLERIEAELAGVDAALQRLDEATYGSCTACGGTIDDDTLAADPTATLCRSCTQPGSGGVSGR
jgi:DnaK suppressor protein